jgi:membrane protease YdiL (CAAX protease family)
LIIAFFWAPWHFFLWQAEGSPVSTWQYWLERYVVTSIGSVLVVWICNRARGSILVAGISHAAMNTAEAFIPISNGQIAYLTCFAAALVVILVDRMWKKLPPDHPAVYRSPERAAQPSVEPTPTLAL